MRIYTVQCSKLGAVSSSAHPGALIITDLVNLLSSSFKLMIFISIILYLSLDTDFSCIIIKWKGATRLIPRPNMFVVMSVADGQKVWSRLVSEGYSLLHPHLEPGGAFLPNMQTLVALGVQLKEAAGPSNVDWLTSSKILFL